MSRRAEARFRVGQSQMEIGLPVTAKLSRKFYEQFGDAASNELVDWFNSVDATYQGQVREINESNRVWMDARFGGFDARTDARFAAFEARMDAFEARMDGKYKALEARMDAFEARMDGKYNALEAQMGAFEARMDAKLSAFRTEMVLWMFGFWTATVLPLAALELALHGVFTK